MLAILISSFIIMLASFFGIIFTWGIFGNFIKKNVGLLVSFSAGVFLILIIGLVSEVFKHTQTFTEPLFWILCGILGVLSLFKLLPSFHHHHSDEHEDDAHSKLDVRKIVISDSIHNIGDGILLATAFAVSLPVGIAAVISVFVHEIVQEISEFFVLKQAGLSTKKSLIINFISSGSILIGSIGGFFLLEVFESIEVPLLSLSVGAFLVVIVQDLIPESVRHSRKKKNYIQHILFFLMGVLVMFGVSTFVSHAHEYEHDHEYNHEEHEDEHGHEGEHKDDHGHEDEHEDVHGHEEDDNHE